MSQAERMLERQDNEDKSIFGFWLYLMTDCVLFASLFATYAVMNNATFGGPGATTLFSLPYVFTETMILLTSSFVCGLAILEVRRRARAHVLILLGIVFLLGAAFLGLEISEFQHLIAEGNGWQRSGFLSAYFTLVSTHGLHILVGLVWLGVLMARVYMTGLGARAAKRLMLFSLFWHFLDLIWIFIFSIVYLLGAA